MKLHYRPFFFLLLFTLFQPFSLSAATHTSISNNISTLCQNKPIILFGETHQQPESQMLFLALVQHYVQQRKRIFIGLEIPADKQAGLDEVLSGNGSEFSFIYRVIDHPAYREMIVSLGKLKGDITVRAIDARDDENSREVAMSRNLALALSSGDYNKIIALVGSNHVIKKIKWHEDLDSDNKYLAEILIADGIRPCSVKQLFRKDGGDPVLVTTDTARGDSLAVESIKYLNHSDNMIGKDICDIVVEWK